MPQYPREEFEAYPEIVVMRDPASPRAQWIARIYSYKPIGYSWKGATLAAWPEDLPLPIYPEFPHNGTREQIDRWRMECNQISAANPQAITLLHQADGYVEAIDPDEAEAEARRRSQHWVSERMNNYRRQ